MLTQFSKQDQPSKGDRQVTLRHSKGSMTVFGPFCWHAWFCGLSHDVSEGSGSSEPASHHQYILWVVLSSSLRPWELLKCFMGQNFPFYTLQFSGIREFPVAFLDPDPRNHVQSLLLRQTLPASIPSLSKSFLSAYHVLGSVFSFGCCKCWGHAPYLLRAQSALILKEGWDYTLSVR